MWKEVNKFARSHTVLSAFLLSALFISVVTVFGILLLDLTPPLSLAIFTIGQFLLSGTAIWVMHKLEVFDINDFILKGIGKGFLLAWFGFLYIAITFFINFMSVPENGYIAPNAVYLLIVILHPFFGTGLFEEVLYRGLVLKILLKKTGGTKKGIRFACIISSLIFGLLHVGNLFAGAPVLQTVSQIITAAAFGVFCAAVFVRTRKIWIPVLIHGLLNLAAQIFNAIVSPDLLLQSTEPQAGIDIIGFILFLLFEALPILIAGLILLRKVKPENIVN